MFVKNVRDITEVYTDTQLSSTDSVRLAALQRLCLLDSPVDPAFDRLTRLAARMLHAPVSLVTLLDHDRQFFKSQIGLPEPWATQRETPLSHSLCQHVVRLNAPLIISDTREQPLVQHNLAIRDLNAIAYAGIPLLTSDGIAIGSFCVIDHEPRVWTQAEIDTLTDLATSVMTEIELIDAHEAQRRAEQQIALLQAQQIQDMAAMNKKLVELEQVKSDMIRVAAHDLRNPLALVMGYSELMLEEGEELAEHHREFVTSILRSGQKMLSLIKDILALERITGDPANTYQTVNFRLLAHEVFETNRDHAGIANLSYTFSADEGRTYALNGDPGQLREAIENLLTNAIKYTPAGGSVSVQIHDKGDFLLFQVNDTGYGIPEADQERLFQAFYRVPTDETYKIGGTGLGLHLVKNIIERHGGKVTFKSVYKQGSSFGFYLPTTS